jgi:hypothetical protein
MLRACTALDDRCRDAIASALGTGPAVVRSRLGGSWLWAVASVAAAVVLGVVLWSAFTVPPDVPGRIVMNTDDPVPTTMRGVELAVDRYVPEPPPQMIRPVRHVERIPVGLFDAESGQLRIIFVDRQQEQRRPEWLDL